MQIGILEFFHVLGALFFLGGGTLIAYFKFRADHSEDLVVLAWYHRELVRADWIFTLPSGVILIATGIALANSYGLPLDQGWILSALVAFSIATLSWIPAVFLQIRMRNTIQLCLEQNLSIPASYHQDRRRWMLLGLPAFSAALYALWLMTAGH